MIRRDTRTGFGYVVGATRVGKKMFPVRATDIGTKRDET